VGNRQIACGKQSIIRAAAVQWAERIMRKIDNLFPPVSGKG
jgi:hypothetical protein